MKEKLTFLISSVVIATLISVLAVSIALQKSWLPVSPVDNFDTGDSIRVAQIYEQLESPEMYSIQDVMELQQKALEETTVNELFLSLTPDVLQNVTSVLLKTQGFATKKSIVNEYRLNDKVYNNLPVDYDKSDAKKDSVDIGATDLGNRSNKTISSSFQRHVDTVNGKPVSVITETTKRYE